jgi:integrase
MVPNGRQSATKLKPLADACRGRYWREFCQAAGGPPGQVTPLAKWIDEFCDWNGHHASPQHVQNNRRQVQRFLDASEAVRVADLSDTAILAFLSGLRDGGPSGKPAPAAERTVEKYRNTIHKFCKYLLRKGEIERNPAEFVEIRPPVKRPPRYLDDDQIAAFLAHAQKTAEPWLYHAACLGLYAGLRLSELIKLQWGDVGREAITTGGKSRDYRFVPIVPPLRPIIAGMKPPAAKKGPVFQAKGKRQWAEAFCRLTKGLPVFGELPGRRAGNQWHLLRSTYAVQQARGAWTGRPCSLWELMAWMGHKSPETTMRYVNIAHAAGMAAEGGSEKAEV